MVLVEIIIAIILGIIPAKIAEEKGHDGFGRWWIYGTLLFPIAFIHSLSLKDKTTSFFDMPTVINVPNEPNNKAVVDKSKVADEILKYKELLDCGAITQEEFDKKKKELLDL